MTKILTRNRCCSHPLPLTIKTEWALCGASRGLPWVMGSEIRPFQSNAWALPELTNKV